MSSDPKNGNARAVFQIPSFQQVQTAQQATAQAGNLFRPTGHNAATARPQELAGPPGHHAQPSSSRLSGVTAGSTPLPALSALQPAGAPWGAGHARQPVVPSASSGGTAAPGWGPPSHAPPGRSPALQALNSSWNHSAPPSATTTSVGTAAASGAYTSAPPHSMPSAAATAPTTAAPPSTSYTPAPLHFPPAPPAALGAYAAVSAAGALPVPVWQGPTGASGSGGGGRGPVGNSIQVARRQAGNTVLKHINNVRWTFADVVGADFILGENTCALFLSLRYHLLHPTYVLSRIKGLQRAYGLQVLLVHIDVEDVVKPLNDISKAAITNGVTLVCAWSPEECARYLETFKAYESKPAAVIQERVDRDYASRLAYALTGLRGVNKADAVTLGGTFGTLASIMKASAEDLSACPGIGPTKVRRLLECFNEPFRKTLNPAAAAAPPSTAGTLQPGSTEAAAAVASVSPAAASGSSAGVATAPGSSVFGGVSSPDCAPVVVSGQQQDAAGTHVETPSWVAAGATQIVDMPADDEDDDDIDSDFDVI